MSRAELTTSFAQASAKRKRRPGPDGISDGILSLVPRAAARLAHPLITKWAGTQVEPLALKGAQAAALYKGSGPQDLMRYYRSVLLENSLAKHHYAFLRSATKSVLYMSALQCQCSTRAHRGVDIAALTLRLHSATARQHRRTAVYLFSDIISAYYCACRQMVWGLDPAQGDLDHIFGVL